MKKNGVVVFGGDSAEHDISVLTGLHCAKNFPDKMMPILVYLTRGGQMVTSQRHGYLSSTDVYTKDTAKSTRKCWFGGGDLYCQRGLFGFKFGAKKVPIQAVVNCCHGGAGEDGRLASMLEVLGVPVTSCGPVAAANLQSKTRTREILAGKKDFLQPSYQKAEKGQAIPENVKYPVIIKPDTLGSSIGITVARNEKELETGLELAFAFDNAAIIEEFLDKATEINCSAFRYGDKILVSRCEVIDKTGPVFDYDSKYLDTASGFIKKGSTSGKVHEKEEEIQALTRQAYELFGARGVVRADFLVVGAAVYLNEINTVPGFMAYHLWLKSGLGYAALIEMMVDGARKSASKGQIMAFESEILQKNRLLVE